MKLTKSKNFNPNYLAKIVQIDSFRPHPNAERLKLCTVDGCVISTSIDSVEGIYIYFPVECVITPEFLKVNNLYRKPELNADPTKQGFFEESGRVKCIKLRGLASEGLVMPIYELYKFIGEGKDAPIDSVEASKLVGTEFDTVNDKLFVWKYVIQVKTSLNRSNKINKAKAGLSILENQFRYHIDTELLAKNIEKVNPNDMIQISWKEHGTSAIFCNLLAKVDYPIHKRVLNKISNLLFKNSLYPNYEYYKFCSSRKVVKDPKLNPGLTKGYYDYDIWNLAFEVVKDFLQKGMTIYAEIVGYMPNGGYIQSGYDYQCVYDPKVYEYAKMTPRQMYDAKLFNIIVYRITYTNIDGKVYEFSTQQVKEFCAKYQINSVKELYYGRAKDLFPNIDVENHWHENFLAKLRNTYLEKQSVLCNNKVPEEGIVLRKEVSDIEVYKLKAIAFLERETKMLDKGEADIESSQG